MSRLQRKARDAFGKMAAMSCALTVVTTYTNPACAQTDNVQPIKIGLLYAKQGPSAAISESLVQGAELAMHQSGQRLLGRPIQLIWLDDPNPQVGQQNMQKLIDEDHVVAVMGGTISSSALAMAALAQRRKIPYIATNAAATELTGKSCNRYTFRTLPTVRVFTNALIPYMSEAGKKFYSITPSYAFGQDALKEFGSQTSKIGGSVIGSDEVAIGTSDYSAYMLKIRAAKPDAVLTALVGDGLSNFLKQWSEFGLKGKIPIGGVSVSVLDFWNAGAKATTGEYSLPWYYADPNNTDEEKKFTTLYETQYHHPPSEKAWQSWFSTRALLQAIGSAKSTDPKSIVLALEKWHAVENGINVRFRASDHQLVRPLVILRAKQSISDKYDFFDVAEHALATSSELEAAYTVPAELACRMPAI
ncbi:ABC transporter substrate-binding protein [Burkholderia anthina]|uniref:ABC transporter substrate-binding protein n=1 Tax=Burkholderia anthina TaxID=179879 RepID=UPI00158D822B|nr:ABC transporter substrate-binding protein [Burkholderia anthina]